MVAAKKKSPPKKNPPVSKTARAKKTTLTTNGKAIAAHPKAKAKIKQCMYSRCKKEAVTEGYCRLHFIAAWKTIQLNKRIKAEKKLNAYVEQLAKKYPNDYMEKIKESLENDDEFKKTMGELKGESDTDTDPDDTPEGEFLEKFTRKLKID